MQRTGVRVNGADHVNENGKARVALVHDWLPVYAGAERVLEQMLHLFPEADLFTLIECLPPDQRAFLQGRSVQTSFIQQLPFARRAYRYYLPLAPLAIEQFDLRDYEVVISSSYVVAKGVLTTAEQLHISYVHSPIRYAWDLYFQYLEQGGLRRGVRSWLARLILHYLRLYDATTAGRPDILVANSRHVARRIWKTYRRRAHVIYPPVDTAAFVPETAKEDFYVTISRLVPYKRVDLIVQAFASMPRRQLVVIGDGPEMDRIARMAPPNVVLLGYQPFEVMHAYLQRARAFVFAAEEDFGIVPVEAMACGTPVIAYGRGGVRETVVEGETGLFFYEQTPGALKEAIERFEDLEASLSIERIRLQAEQFSIARFRKAFSRLVERAYQKFLKKKRGQQVDSKVTI
ncbi:MAG: glycosyltransferase family 4 protein [Rhodothermus sp.]|nr:glycosyltransferase family 4 protein [Rhodothermus sp.]